MAKIDTQPIKDRIAELDRQLKVPFPTPPVGTMVIWYARADRKDGAEIASIVTKIEEPGKLQLVAFRPFGMPEHKRGVLHSTHPIHENRSQSASVDAGCWDYPIGTNIPKAHYRAHEERLGTLRDTLVSQLAQADSQNKESVPA